MDAADALDAAARAEWDDLAAEHWRLQEAYGRLHRAAPPSVGSPEWVANVEAHQAAGE